MAPGGLNILWALFAISRRRPQCVTEIALPFFAKPPAESDLKQSTWVKEERQLPPTVAITESGKHRVQTRKTELPSRVLKTFSPKFHGQKLYFFSALIDRLAGDPKKLAT